MSATDAAPQVSYAAFQWWADVLPAAEVARVEARLNPDPNKIALSAAFPCPKCELMTPHHYFMLRDEDVAAKRWNIRPGAGAPNPPPHGGRTTMCVVCQRHWLHHVPFKCVPSGPHEMSEIMRRQADDAATQ